MQSGMSDTHVIVYSGIGFQVTSSRSEATLMFQDKTLVCKDCGQEFVFTAGEQEFYATKGFQNEPLRCKECRDLRKSQFNGKRTKEMYDAVCAQCGKETKVPFKPHLDKPVYCSDCFSNR
jgi:CxxC-x17-CxxC domain-containing protein